ncbi:MAG TPA: hypothetical protein VGF14_00930, partial [Alphaproteobacteria bacterium]
KSLIVIDEDEALKICGQNNDGLLDIIQKEVDAGETAILIYNSHTDVSRFTGEIDGAVSKGYHKYLAQVPAMNGHVVARDGIVRLSRDKGPEVEVYSSFMNDLTEAYDNISTQYNVGKDCILVLHLQEDGRRVAQDAGCHTADPMDYNHVRRSIIDLKYSH